MRDAQIEDIAQAVGINRAIVYRHFTGKEELFALTLTGYLDELRDALAAGADRPGDPAERLTAIVTAFVDYGLDHPAFVDCAQTLMRRTGPELLDEISESAMFRLGRSISACLSVLSGVIDDGVTTGDFERRRHQPAGQPALRQRARRAPARPRRHAGRRVRPGHADASARCRGSRCATSSWPRPSRSRPAGH